MKKILAVCGDSFMTPCKRYPNTHFTELIADQLEYELLILARAAISNGGICIQIEEAIRRKVDFIIIGFTTSERMELPLPGHGGKYDKSIGVENIDYSRHFNSVSQRANTEKTNLICETIESVVDSNRLSDEYITALKYYLTYIHDSTWQKQKDIWMTNFLMKKVVESKIPFLLYSDIHYNNHYIEDYAWIPGVNSAAWEDSPHYYGQVMFGPATYHTSEDAQRLIALAAINQINKILKK